MSSYPVSYLNAIFLILALLSIFPVFLVFVLGYIGTHCYYRSMLKNTTPSILSKVEWLVGKQVSKPRNRLYGVQLCYTQVINFLSPSPFLPIYWLFFDIWQIVWMAIEITIVLISTYWVQYYMFNISLIL